jgi:hypothetical protein
MHTRRTPLPSLMAAIIVTVIGAFSAAGSSGCRGAPPPFKPIADTKLLM